MNRRSFLAAITAVIVAPIAVFRRPTPSPRLLVRIEAVDVDRAVNAFKRVSDHVKVFYSVGSGPIKSITDVRVNGRAVPFRVQPLIGGDALVCYEPYDGEAFVA